MDNYSRWIRLKAVLILLGITLFICPFLISSLQDWDYSWAILILGIVLFQIGMHLGVVFQRQKFTQAMLEHEKKLKNQLRAKQPWEK
ncbi:MAG: hypothetical protein GW861_14775 [Deltaproteobacteria bacterium]|nr:hypothetical protein [Vibrio sp.]NCP04623.1 hypothetical protein [Deltaproteobacteria bacterium]